MAGSTSGAPGERFRVSDVVAWTRGTLVQGDADDALDGVAIDSRATFDGALFVAIVGPNHDAHRFLADVAGAKVGGLLVAADRPLDPSIPPTLPVVAVPDTTVALGAIAAGHRDRFDGPVVAITGSSGKTTTKEMCAAILGAAGPCLSTQGNLNNEFGLPLTLLRRTHQHERIVVELGMNHRGEIARLAAIAKPTVALVTNVGIAHIEFLGSRDEIAREKGDLYAALPSSGTAVANLDDERAAAQAARGGCRVLTFGRHGEGDVRVDGPTRFEAGTHAFSLATPLGCVEVSVTGLGDTTVTNATAATAAAIAAGASLDDVAEGLAAYRPPSGRMAPYPLDGGATLIDDSYNANPDSMNASLSALADVARGGRAIAVLGDMGELGDTGEASHRDAGRRAAELGVDLLYAVGAFAPIVVEAARAAGLPAERTHVFADPDAVGAHLRERLSAGDWVLVKGSRAMKMERVSQSLRGAEGRP